MRPEYREAFQERAWSEVMPGVRHKVFDQGGRRLRLVEYTPAMEPHWCEKGHYGFMLEGRFEIQFPDRTETYIEGDGLFLPPGPEHRHMARALTDVVRVFFVEERTGM